jgi:predicted dithiol-disulfide oxidoreductase (DUF899 family)/uncharacterized protein YndB with AHSA1/START domain
MNMQILDVPILSRASDAYRTQRAALLRREQDVIEEIERVAALRRTLPDGPAIENYAFVSAGAGAAATRLSDLFQDSDVLLAYNMMFGPGDDAPCPMCTRWVDGFDALAPRVRDVVPLVVFARQSPARLAALAASRGWSIPLYSAPQPYSREVGAEDADGGQEPLITVFRKDRSGAISLWYSQTAMFPDGSLRGIDLLNPLWGLLDLLPAGRGDYNPPQVALGRPLRQIYEVYIRTTPERLWQAITDPEMTRQYFYDSAVDSSWQVGAPLNRLRPDGSRMVEGEILEFDPPRRLVHTFVFTDSELEDRDPPSRVTWEIVPVGQVCKLTLTHEHYAGESETYKGTLTGWNPVLNGLKTLLETGKPLRLELEEAPARS